MLLARNSQLRCLSVFVLLAVVGCQPEPEIETYQVERTTPLRPVLDAAEVLEQLDHILVAIVPQEDKAWFFKLVGKAAAIDRQRNAFADFMATVELADSAGETPTWKLPAGWTAKEASQMRAATLVVPDDKGELEVAVSSLSLNGEWDDFLVPNVNRWLGQLQRRELAKPTILKLAQELSTADAKATVFELSGIMSAGPMGRNPHAGLGIPAPGSRESAAKPSGQQAAPSKELTFKTPAGWLPGKMNSMRKAAFLLPGGGPTDEVKVTSFPIGQTQMGDFAFNVQRWAGQVSMPLPTAAEAKELATEITIAGLSAQYVELTSPEGSKSQRSIYAAMLKRNGEVWFFNLDGKPALVAGQRDAFREFLDSVQFTK